MAKLDSADSILDDDDNQFFRSYLPRTGSIAGNGKHAGHAFLLTSSAAVLTKFKSIGQTELVKDFPV